MNTTSSVLTFVTEAHAIEFLKNVMLHTGKNSSFGGIILTNRVSNITVTVSREAQYITLTNIEASGSELFMHNMLKMTDDDIDYVSRYAVHATTKYICSNNIN